MSNYEWDERDLARFYRKVPERPGGECWPWRGTMFDTGYGAFSLQGRNRGAHRVSYQIHRGEIPAGLVLDHLCRTRSCVNPEHLEPVRQGENVRRGESPSAQAQRAGTCSAGLHDMTDVYVKPDGMRQCRPCQIQRARQRRRDAGLKGNHERAKTHCPSGHEYAGDNLYVVPSSGHRQCKACRRARQLKK